MRRTLIAIISALSVLALAHVTSAAGDMTVKDSSGKVIIQDATAIDIPELVGLLDRGGAVEAVRARDILVELAPDSVPALTGAIKKGPAYENVMYALGRIKDKRAIAPVASYINDPDWPVANVAMGVLKSYGDAASPELLGLVKDPEYLEPAIEVLMYMTPSRETVESVRNLTKSSIAGERAAAGYLLGWWKDADSENDIIGLFGDVDADVRRRAVRGYKALHNDHRDRYDVNAILDLLKDPDPGVREASVDLLIGVEDNKIVGPLLEVIKSDDNQTVRAKAIEAIEDTGDDSVVMPMIEVLQDDSSTPPVLANALYVLALRDAKEAVPFIVDMYREGYVEDGNVQQETFDTLRVIGEPVELGLFMRYLVDGDPHYVGTQQLLDMLAVLAKPGDEDVIDGLRKYVDNGKNPDWVKTAGEILERIE